MSSQYSAFEVGGGRGSVRSRLANVVFSTAVRPLVNLVPAEKTWGLEVLRQTAASMMAAFGPEVAGVQTESVDVTLADGRRVLGEWVRTPNVVNDSGVIYYVHGGGYAMCSPRTHRQLIAWIADLTGVPVFAVDYRLAPQHVFPAAADDVRSGWDWLLKSTGLGPSRVVVGGDSAGGHLVVDLMLQLVAGGERPAGAVLLSPLYDFTFALAAQQEKLRPDPAMTAEAGARVARLYRGGVDPTHPRLALNVAGSAALAPTLIQVGSVEMLSADARRLADDIRAAGGSCELQVWPDQIHVFQALPKLAPDAHRAVRAAAAFITEQLGITGHTLLPS